MHSISNSNFYRTMKVWETKMKIGRTCTNNTDVLCFHIIVPYRRTSPSITYQLSSVISQLCDISILLSFLLHKCVGRAQLIYNLYEHKIKQQRRKLRCKTVAEYPISCIRLIYSAWPAIMRHLLFLLFILSKRFRIDNRNLLYNWYCIINY